MTDTAPAVPGAAAGFPRDDLAVGAEVGVVRIARGDRLSPGGRQACCNSAREGLVNRGLDHVRAQVVLIDERPPRITCKPVRPAHGLRWDILLLRGRNQRVIVLLPELLIALTQIIRFP